MEQGAFVMWSSLMAVRLGEGGVIDEGVLWPDVPERRGDVLIVIIEYCSTWSMFPGAICWVTLPSLRAQISVS